MQPNFFLRQAPIAAQSQPTYTVVTFQGKNYRILTKQHKGYLETAKIWAVFWYLIALCLLGSAFVLLFELKVAFILPFCLAANMFFTIYAYIKRAQFSQSVFYSSLNLLVFLVPVTALAFLQIKQILIPLCFYCLIQTYLSIKYMTNKSQMIAKFLLLIQTLMVALKVDQKIQSSWLDILFSHLVFFFFLSLCIVFMTVYLIYMMHAQNQQNLMKYKFTGALFIYFNTIAFCLLSLIPLLNVYIEVKIWFLCFSMVFLLVCLATFIYSYQTDIVIFFCNLNEIKSFNQIISFQAIEEICSPQNHFRGKKKDKKLQPMYLYKVSQNWVSKSPQKTTQNQVQNPEVKKQQDDNQNSKMTYCLICLDKPAEVVWMPCGHLAVCMQCCSFMFQKRNMNCVLCKKPPEQIFLIDKKESMHNNYQSFKDQRQLNLDVSIENNDVSVISGSVLINKQKNVDSKTQIVQSKCNNKTPPNSKNSKKIVFTVLEGYHVKII